MVKNCMYMEISVNENQVVYEVFMGLSMESIYLIIKGSRIRPNGYESVFIQRMYLVE